jgi:hypothetical protein
MPAQPKAKQSEVDKPTLNGKKFCRIYQCSLGRRKCKLSRWVNSDPLCQMGNTFVVLRRFQWNRDQISAGWLGTRSTSLPGQQARG